MNKLVDFTLKQNTLRIHRIQQCAIYYSTFIDITNASSDEETAIAYIGTFLGDELIKDIEENFSSEGWIQLLAKGIDNCTFRIGPGIMIPAYRKYISLYPEDYDIKKCFAAYLAMFYPDYEDDAVPLLIELVRSGYEWARAELNLYDVELPEDLRNQNKKS